MRIWCATGDDHNDKDKAAKLYMINTSRKQDVTEIHQMRDQIILSNAMCFNEPNTKFYIGCSVQKWVDQWQCDINNRDAQQILSNRKRIITLQDPEVPDGMTCDIQGNLYLAIFGGGKIQVYNSEGQPLYHIPTPTLCPTCCVFMGPDLNELFITSKEVDLDTWEGVEKCRTEANNSEDMYSAMPDRNGWIYSVILSDVQGVLKPLLP